MDNLTRGRPRAARRSSSSFPPRYHLKRKSDFARLEREGKRLYSGVFLIVIAASPTGDSRLAVAVTRKLDKRAVIRNKIRRRIREIFRLHRTELNGAFDMLVIARRASLDSSYAHMERHLLGALRHHGYLISSAATGTVK